MADIVIDFSKGPKRIALIVRGKLGPAHHPDKMAQHADVVLSDGSPWGYFGEGNSRSTNKVGMSMQGVVYNYGQMWDKRPYYVDVDTAVVNGVVSSILVLEVTAAEARKFDDYWKQLAFKPGTFNIVGGNCSSNASDAFISAGVLREGIPWLDTPDNLYGQLEEQKRTMTRYTGYIGFRQKDMGLFDVVIRPYTSVSHIPDPDGSARTSSSMGSGRSS